MAMGVDDQLQESESAPQEGPLAALQNFYAEHPVLFPAIIIAIIALLIFVIAPIALPGESGITLTIQNERAQGIRQEIVKVYVDGQVLDENLVTDFSGKTDRFTVRRNATIRVELDSDDFAIMAPDTFVADQEEMLVVVKAKAKEGRVTPITISVQTTGNRVIQKTVYLELSCRNAQVTFPAETANLSASDGLFGPITPPLNCGNVTATAHAEGFASVSRSLISGNNTIYLESSAPQIGSVRVMILDEATQNRVTGPVSVSLTNHETNEVVATQSTVSGQADFSQVEKGAYYATVSDSTGTYTQTRAGEKFGVIADDVTETSVTMTQNPAAVVHISIQTGSNPVSGARVFLQDGNGQVVFDQTTTSNGKLDATLFALGTYRLQVNHPEYLAQTIQLAVNRADMNQTVLLQRCGSSSTNPCGQLKVHVVDEDDLPVPNASVLIYDANTNFLSRLDPVITDLNGYARFSNLATGDYWLKARKYPSETPSSGMVGDSFHINSSVPSEQTMVLVIGRGVFEVAIRDEFDQVVPNARIEFRTNNPNECNAGKCVTETDQAGLASYAFKADKRVFAMVSKSGYSDFVTQSRQVFPNEVRHVDVTLQKALLGEHPEVQSPKILDGNGRGASTLMPGKTYIARFLVRLPSDLNASQAGLFVRLGNEASVESDFATIESVDAGGSNLAVFFGTTYNPPTSEALDMENQTLTHAKWGQLTWNNPRQGAYAVDVVFRVKPDAQVGQSIPLFYRAWVTSSNNGSVMRSPLDSVLGEGTDSSVRDGLYAQSLTTPLQVGELLSCETDVCLSNQKLLDTTEELYLNDPYELNVFGLYDYSFALTNRSNITLPEAQLKISSWNGSRVDDVINILSYEVNSPQSNRANANLDAFETGLIDLGDLANNESTQVQLKLQPKVVRGSGIKIELRAGNRIVFEKTVTFAVSSDNELNMEITPDVIGALIETDLNITVTDQAGIEIQDAVIRTKIKDLDGIRTNLADVKTDQLGRATITIPENMPGVKVTIEAQKENYKSTAQEFTVDENVIEFTPFELSSRLNLTAKRTEEIITQGQGKIPSLLLLTGAKLTGRFYGLLDEDAMNAFLISQIGVTEFNPDSAVDLRVQSKINNSLILRKPKDASGNVLVQVQSEKYPHQQWRINLPFKVHVDLGQSVDTPDCLTLSLKEWKGSTLMGAVSEEFTIANNCTVNGKAVALNQLLGSLTWTGNVLGNVELAISDPTTGSLSTQTLQNGQTVVLWDQIAHSEDQTYNAIITFVPHPDTIGQTAKFQVNLDGTVTSNQGETLVGSSNPILGNLTIQNLEQCLEFSPGTEEGLRLKPDDDEKELTINAANCGYFRGGIKLRFCQDTPGNTNCRGGTRSGGIELSTYDTTLNENSKTITVVRQQVPGHYGLTVEARVGSQTFRKIIDYPVIIEPRNTDAFALDKYTFTLIGQNSQDSTAFYNRLLEEDVKVKADICVWMETIQLAQGTGDDGAAMQMVGTVLFAAGAALALYTLSASTAEGATASVLANNPTTFTTIGAAIAVVGIVLILLSASESGAPDTQDICRQYYEETLRDFVINLRGGTFGGNSVDPDAGPLLMEMFGGQIKPEWNLDVTNAYTDKGKRVQEVGLVFTNTAGLEKPDSLYDVINISATEHIHGGNTTHDGSARVDCKKAGFNNYYIPCDEDEQTRTEQIHVRFKTAPIEDRVLPVEFDTVSCSQGALIGRTGPGAIPKIKLNWSWRDGEGISMDTCDEANPDAVYCDATQFSIMMAKRIHAFDTFVKANDYFEGICPSVDDSEFLVERTATVPIGKVGIEETRAEKTGMGQATITVTLANNTSTDQIVNASTNIRFFNIQQNIPAQTCTQSITVPAGETADFNCVKSLVNGIYYTDYNLTVTDASIIQTPEAQITLMFEMKDPTTAAEGSNCRVIRTTESFLGQEPLINAFVNEAEKKGTLKWTNDISSTTDLTNLFHFNALLMKDGFSKDFREDFVNYYAGPQAKTILDAPEWFTSEGGLQELWKDHRRFLFSQKYYNTYLLPAAGTYMVDVGLYFKDDWRIMGDNGKMVAGGGVTFYLQKEPSTNTAFYDMPFNGGVGLSGAGSLSRQEYGTQYINDQNPLPISHLLDTPKTWNDAGSFALQEVRVGTLENFEYLNSRASTRGNILSVKNYNDGKRIEFTPSFATPLLMELSIEKKTSQPVTTFYSLSQNNAPLADVGSNAILWTGAANCRDFTGQGITQSFIDRPDRPGRQEDSIGEWQLAYGLDWEQVTNPGKTALRTIVYSPRNVTESIRTIPSLVKANFYTPDSEGSTVNLNGISGMQKNRPGTDTGATINSIQDVFDLVEEGSVCVTNTGVLTRFWWNPQTIYTTAGKKPSVHDKGETYVSGQTCA